MRTQTIEAAYRVPKYKKFSSNLMLSLEALIDEKDVSVDPGENTFGRGKEERKKKAEADKELGFEEKLEAILDNKSEKSLGIESDGKDKSTTEFTQKNTQLLPQNDLERQVGPYLD